MPLSAGHKLGPYEILAPIGAGGMGEVYRAHDSRLNRDVAIKVSAAQFTERFEREAKAIAALNHPNICQIYDVGPNYLVMEFIEGDAPKGPMPLDEVLRIARQIADALEAAHEKGITHRDLKPGNIKIKPDGTVKVLDFGLAKVMAAPAESGANSPTLTMGMTQAGMILGTASYMAPEQARGKENVDKRADIWAFGVVLYELLTGKPMFTGEDVGEILAKVIRDEPDLRDAPPRVRGLLKACLEKDPKNRLRDIADGWRLVEDPRDAKPAAPEKGRRLPWIIAAGVCAVAALTLAFVHFREKPLEQPVTRLSIPVPGNSLVGYVALSPDGRRLAAVLTGEGKNAEYAIWLRALDSAQFQLLPGTDLGRDPFWSPDGRFVGFFADGKLKTIPASGGPAQALCDAGLGQGGSWNRDRVILFGTEAPGPIMRVNAAGGPCTAVTKAEPNARHSLPEFLPDGRHFFYLVQAAEQAKTGVYLAALDDPAGLRLLADRSAVIYTSPAPGSRLSHLLFLRETTLMAQPFDAAALQLAGDPFPVVPQASRGFGMPWQAAASAASGVLVYLANRTFDRQLVWLDRSGKELGKIGPPGAQLGIALSPDGKALLTSSPPDGAVRMRDLARGVETRLTQVNSRALAWSPDGGRIVFTKNQDLYLRDSSGTGAEELLLHSGNVKAVSGWSRDGRLLLYTENDPKTLSDIWYLPDPLQPGAKKPAKFLATDFVESQAQFSPDGKWVAYTSNESGQFDIYVRPFPRGPGQWRVSTNPSSEPRWSRDGKELFYLEQSGLGNRVMAVAVRPGARGTPEFGSPQKLFEYRGIGVVPQNNVFAYSPAPDGQRFLVDIDADTAEPVLNVITNWQAALKK